MVLGDIAVSPERTGNGRPAPDGTDAPAGTVPAGRLAYNPALDGIRGLAVAAVLLFHGGVSWARGGFLGVSTFFTLSGFLITSLLVAERHRSGRIDLRRFWSRRLRRLFPASAVTLVAVSLSALVLDEQWERSLRGDALAALAQVANWRMLVDERSYAELFASPSPLVHFWSLAIEEQFYWVFPLVTAGVMLLAKGSLRVYAAVLAGLVGISALATVALGPGRGDTVYYATYTRMGEILVGSLLAVAVAAGLSQGAVVRRVAAVLGILGLVASAWAVTALDQTREVLDRGGLLAYALASAALVLGATVPGPLHRALAFEPLRLLGVISYGVYLFHWPLFLVLDEERTGLEGAGLFAVRVAVTLVAAIASYRLIERPVRLGWRPRGVPVLAVAVASVVLVAGLAVGVPAMSSPPVDPYEQLAAATLSDPAELDERTLVGVALGDSTMLMTGWGLTEWGRRTGELDIPGYAGDTGCGILRHGERMARGQPTTQPARCEDWAAAIPEETDDVLDRYGRVEFGIVQTGPWDVADRRLPGDATWRSPGDPVYDAYLRSELEAATELIAAQDLVVVWLTAPQMDVGRDEPSRPTTPYSEGDPGRVDALNRTIRSIAAERDGVVVVDLAAYVDALPEEVDRRLRPDGVHFTGEAADRVADDWLGPQVVDAVRGEIVAP